MALYTVVNVLPGTTFLRILRRYNRLDALFRSVQSFRCIFHDVVHVIVPKITPKIFNSFTDVTLGKTTGEQFRLKVIQSYLHLHFFKLIARP